MLTLSRKVDECQPLAVERRVNPYFRIKDRAFLDKAGGVLVLRTRTRPTLHRLTEFACLCEHKSWR
jgi:hypothetical protein